MVRRNTFVDREGGLPQGGGGARLVQGNLPSHCGEGPCCCDMDAALSESTVASTSRWRLADVTKWRTARLDAPSASSRRSHPTDRPPGASGASTGIHLALSGQWAGIEGRGKALFRRIPGDPPVAASPRMSPSLSLCPPLSLSLSLPLYLRDVRGGGAASSAYIIMAGYGFCGDHVMDRRGPLRSTCLMIRLERRAEGDGPSHGEAPADMAAAPSPVSSSTCACGLKKRVSSSVRVPSPPGSNPTIIHNSVRRSLDEGLIRPKATYGLSVGLYGLNKTRRRSRHRGGSLLRRA